MSERRRPPAGEPARLGFDRQFDRRRQLEVETGWVGCIELDPPRPANRLPLLVVPGWAEGHQSQRDFARVLYRQRRRALLLDFSYLRAGDGPHETHREVSDKSAALLRALAAINPGRVDVLAHSEGSLAAVYAARHRPDYFNNLVLAMPAGMIGPDSAVNLALRFLPKLVRGLSADVGVNPAAAAAINRDGLRHISQNPARAWREIRAVAAARIDQSLHELRFPGRPRPGDFAGRIGILQAAGDTVFPHHFIEGYVRFAGYHRRPNSDAYASIVSRLAGHDDLWLNPERGAVAALQLLDSLEASRRAGS